jgi:hypothetical protein
MTHKFPISIPSLVAPLIAWIIYIINFSEPPGWYAILLAIGLIGAVMSAVHHAEVVAHRVGEPYGTLILAVAITIIEVALIVSLMLAGGPETAAADHFQENPGGVPIRETADSDLLAFLLRNAPFHDQTHTDSFLPAKLGRIW